MTMSGDVVSFGADMQLSGVEQFLQGLERSDRKARELRRELKAAGDEKKRFERRLKATRDGAVKTARAFGGLAKAAGIANIAVVGLGAAAVDKFGDFEMQVARIGTLLPEGVNAMEEFGEGALRASIKYGQGIESVTDSIFQSLSKGVTQDKMGDFNQVVGEAAVGGVIEANVAVNGLTNTVNGFGLAIEDARLVSDKFFVANKLGDTTFGKLAATMGNVSANAKNAGISLDEVLASVVSVTQVGVETSSVMAGLNGIINALQKPTADAEGEFERLGLTMDASVLKAKGLKGVMADLKRALDRNGTPASIANIFGDVEARKVAARVLSEDGFGSLTNALNELGVASGATEKAFSRVADTVGFKMKQIKAGLSAAVIQTGAGIAEGLGLNQAEEIPEKMERAGQSMKTGARSFAEGFKEGFAPVIQAAETDWQGLANTLGRAAGTITQAFITLGIKFAEMASSMQGLIDYAGTVLNYWFGPSAEQVGVGMQKGNLSGGVQVPVTVSSDELSRAQWRSRNAGMSFRDALISVSDTARAADAAGVPILGASTSNSEKAMRGYLAGATALKNAGDTFTKLNEDNAKRRKFAGDGGFMGQPGKSDLGFLTGNGETLKERAIRIDIEHEMSIKDAKGKRKRSGGAFNYRGTGDAKIRSTIEQQYVIFEDQLIPVSDEFHYAHYYEGE